MTYHHVCKGCIIEAGVKPDSVTQSLLASSGKLICEICGLKQHYSWYVHALKEDLPESLAKKLP